MLPWLESRYQQLTALHQQQSFPHAILFSGNRGLGKQTLAKTVAEFLLCHSEQQPKPCGQCKACHLFQAGHHPDYWQAAEAEGRIGVDSIRQLSRFFHEHAQQGGARVAVLPQAERMTEAAANALLKTLEEPPRGGYLLLTSDQPQLLLPTILSRCQQWPLAVAEVRQAELWLQAQTEQVLPDFLRPLISSAPLEALQWLQQGSVEQASDILLQLEYYVLDKASLPQTVQMAMKSAQLPMLLSWFVRERLPRLGGYQPQRYWQLLQSFQHWCRDEQQLLGQNKQLALTALLIELKRIMA
ncbi:DNA polymerase III subunit delta' [Alkalimonas sp. MEB108]|uniref:DNA-directed DNA polymerase n=1 Tax=Alkalimonas cellulosilytica TaxID=3058395 RepID=A0ABU7J575_9GAMM|nr:DNA polymerase III subunit delta' [Alkalimonas sp. MEB108]MEE2001425.1 DNA polymerase III subunit delta' [Alkalimonas sp. MEB108]